jgi:hypothetical protein
VFRRFLRFSRLKGINVIKLKLFGDKRFR